MILGSLTAAVIWITSNFDEILQFESCGFPEEIKGQIRVLWDPPTFFCDSMILLIRFWSRVESPSSWCGIAHVGRRFHILNDVPDWENKAVKFLSKAEAYIWKYHIVFAGRPVARRFDSFPSEHVRS